MMSFHSFDDRSLHTVGCGDLYEILADLAERRLLGALESRARASAAAT